MQRIELDRNNHNSPKSAYFHNVTALDESSSMSPRIVEQIPALSSDSSSQIAISRHKAF